MTIDLRLGDCLDVLRTMPDASVDSVITDPPYGMNYQSARRTDSSKRKPRVANDARPFIWWLYDAYRLTKDGGSLACFCEWRHQEVFRMAIEAAGYTVRSQVIWDREWHGLGDLKAAFAPQHDIIWFATKGRFAFANGRPKSIVRARRIAAETLVHPTEKPLLLMKDLVHALTPVGGIVFDPFMGSGTTGVACLETGRRFIGIESHEPYFDTANRRLAGARIEAA